MTPVVVALLIVGVATLVIVGAILAHRAEQARTRALRQLAARLGLAFDPGRDHGFAGRFPQFDVFQQGRNRYAWNTLSGVLPAAAGAGQDGFTLVAGDFHYETREGTGRDRRTVSHRSSFLIVGLPLQGVPGLLIRREGMLDKLAGFFGFDDIDFESEEFSRRFLVKSSDRRFAYAVVHPEMMQLLLAEKDPTVELAGGACCFTRGSDRWQPKEFAAQIRFAARFFALWPRHLVAELASRS